MMTFQEFLDKYVEVQIQKHAKNPHWRTRESVIELCGGEDEIACLYDLAFQVSPEAQQRILGFTI